MRQALTSRPSFTCARPAAPAQNTLRRMLDTWDLDLFALTTTDICGAAYLVFERAGVVELCGGKRRLWAFINAVRKSYEASSSNAASNAPRCYAAMLVASAHASIRAPNCRAAAPAIDSAALNKKTRSCCRTGRRTRRLPTG